MEKRVLFKWIFCLLGIALLFACSEDYEELTEVDDLIEIENIQIKNGILVFPNHKILKNVINGKEISYADYVSRFKSQQQMFEDVVVAESKQMDYLDTLSGESLEKALKHSTLYETALKEGLIKEVLYSDGTSSYDYNLAVPYYSSVINKDGFFAVQDTLYQITGNRVKMWIGADLEKIDVLAKSANSDISRNIFVFDYMKGQNFTFENSNSLSRISFPAPPSAIRKGVVQYLNRPGFDGIVPFDGRFIVAFVDQIGLALPNYTRDLYIQVVCQKKVNGTNSYGFYGCSFNLFFYVKTETDGVISDIINLGASGICSNVYYTFYPSFSLLAEGKMQQVTDEPYAYILYAEFSTMAKINFVDVTDGMNKDVNAQGMFKMERSSIKNQFFYEIISEHSQWLDTVIE